MARGSLTSRMEWILSVLAGVMVFGISIEKFAGTSFELLHRMDSIERYISVRLDLWGLGIEAFWPNFPWGIGLDQFWQAVGTDVTLAREGHRYANSNFLSLPGELGLFGLLLPIGLLIFVCGKLGLAIDCPASFRIVGLRTADDSRQPLNPHVADRHCSQLGTLSCQT